MMTRFCRSVPAVALALPLMMVVAGEPTADAAAAGTTAKPAKKPAKAGPATPRAVSAPKLDVKSWTLPNGLEVLFLADHKAPIATVQVFYHVGSKDERAGIRGIAHMFEHMMFKGTEHVPPEEHARLLKEVGGQSNAFTTEDITGYHQTVPPSYVGFAMQLEAERMRHLKLTPSTVDSERKVVQEEKRLRIDNNPVGKALEKFRGMAFQKHPYNWLAIGTMEDLQGVTPADCQKFYDTFYVPNNATLIVVGDVDEAEVRKLADQHFGPIPKGATPPRVEGQEPAQDKLRDETLEIEVQVPVIVGGYHIPRASDPDVASLEVLAAILSGGESSRLHQRLVRKEKLALAAGGIVQALEHPGLFLIFAVHLPDKDQQKIRQILLEEIGRMRKESVAADELNKAKNQLAAGHIFKLQSVDGIAGALGAAQYVHGDWKEFLRGAEKYLAVTAKDLQRVADKYFAESNLTMVNMRPLGSGGAPGAGVAAGAGTGTASAAATKNGGAL